ncbi:MAG: hypothetical protein A3H02_02115 [Candidatus Niyogibacteria bacterium RIFCSPLOWO2_12_FULL_41_13]|uniref:Uncharacterized protein n=1 Tax=Candidatus Niyogibacteria bacterium RIFCSPLOWO2_12_FULL_41_13 TaxID=1801726 RepID=A0A1G2F441_9BACT|nr:MAG: hypothetical protein A3H02_02115 [Candidatus Niyogibacteria bacterium RIFCSPLOWO2_12_FULL_41_13]
MLCFTTYYPVESQAKSFSSKKAIFLILIFGIFALSFAYLYFIWQGIEYGYNQKYLQREIQNILVSYQQLDSERLNKLSGLNEDVFKNLGLIEAKNPKFVKAQIFVAEVFSKMR